MTAVAPEDRIAPGTLLAYGLGKAAEGVKTRAFEFFLFFYYVQVLGLSGIGAGAAVAVALACDVVTDPLAGSISDRHHSRLGRRHPFMYAAILPLGASFYLLFVPPSGLGQWGLGLWLTVFAVSVRTSLTVFHVPYLSLGAELTRDYDERTRMAMSRMVFGIAGSLFGLVAGMGYFFRSTPEFSDGQLNAAAYPGFAAVCALVMMLAIFCSAHWTRSEIPRLARPEREQPSFKLRQVYVDLIGALRSPSFRALFLGQIFLAITLGVHATLNLHLSTYYWEFSPAQILLFVFSGAVGFGTSLLAIRRIQRFLDKRRAFQIALGGSALFAALPQFLRELGLLPPNHTPALMVCVLGSFMVAAFCGAIAAMSGASMMPDVTDAHELDTGRRQEGIFFGAASFSGKFSSAIGHVIAGAALDVIAFPKDVVPGEVAADVLSRLGWLTGPGVAIFGVLGLYFFAGYALSRERHVEIQAALEARRAG